MVKWMVAMKTEPSICHTIEGNHEETPVRLDTGIWTLNLPIRVQYFTTTPPRLFLYDEKIIKSRSWQY